MNQDNLRIRMNALLADYGTKQCYICQACDIQPSDLTKFKKSRLQLTPAECERLDRFLDERGYSSGAKALAAIVQGSFDN